MYHASRSRAQCVETPRQAYLAHVLATGSEVEDAITGKRLEIEKQLLNIEMATGEDALRMPSEEIHSLDPCDP